MRQCSKFKDPLTESIMEKEAEGEEGRERRRKGKDVIYCFLTQTCAVANRGTQCCRNPTSRNVRINCMGGD